MSSIYTDILKIEHARGADLDMIANADAYDYERQEWVGADHGHMVGRDHVEADRRPLVFCGATWSSCKGSDHEALAEQFLAGRV